MSRQKILDTAAAELGNKENPPGSNKTKYNEWFGYNGAAWCAMFVSWVYDKAGHPLGNVETSKGFKYVQAGYNHWKTSGEFTSSPQAGDIVIYDWAGDGHCDHTGIFIEWISEGKTFKAYEGNTAQGNDSDGGEVMLRTRNASSVRAYVSPKVLGSVSPPVASANLQRGSRGAEVTDVQKMLSDLGYDLTIDGDFGPGTEKAVKNFQKDHGVEVNGIVTPAVKGMMEGETSKPKVSDNKLTTGAYLKIKSKGAAVVALQKALNKKGAKPPIDEDGDFGSGTQNALKAFQKKNGLDVDGIAGPDTLAALGIKNV